MTKRSLCRHEDLDGLPKSEARVVMLLMMPGLGRQRQENSREPQAVSLAYLESSQPTEKFCLQKQGG